MDKLFIARTDSESQAIIFPVSPPRFSIDRSIRSAVVVGISVVVEAVTATFACLTNAVLALHNTPTQLAVAFPPRPASPRPRHSYYCLMHFLVGTQAHVGQERLHTSGAQSGSSRRSSDAESCHEDGFTGTSIFGKKFFQQSFQGFDCLISGTIMSALLMA